MSTPTLYSTLARLVVGAACVISTASCGGEMLRTGRSPMYLVVTSITAGAEGEELTSFLLSDIRTNGGVANDNVQVGLRLDPKNPSATTAIVNAVTLTRYAVEFRRTDGRNRPGIDVPYGFSGALSTTLSPNGTGNATFELVRHQAKLEPPLANLSGQGFGGLGFLSTIAEVTIYGRDQNGNELMVTATIDVHFADFADEDA
jgi:hypothetical protein